MRQSKYIAATSTTERPRVEGGRTSWPKSIERVHESFNGRHNKFSKWFLPQKIGDRSLTRFDTFEILHSETKTSLPSKDISMAICSS